MTEITGTNCLFNALVQSVANGTPADIGEVAAFLAAVEPNFITGQAITVDGFQWAT